MKPDSKDSAATIESNGQANSKRDTSGCGAVICAMSHIVECVTPPGQKRITTRTAKES